MEPRRRLDGNPADIAAAVYLCNPKFPHNVGSALRSCSVYGVRHLLWDGKRVTLDAAGERLPREERMRAYRDVDFRHLQSWRDIGIGSGWTPVVVEVSEYAEPLFDFIHPSKALYFFGPEDGSVPRGAKCGSHRFVTIPTRSCLNLNVALATVLYDRAAKLHRAGLAVAAE